jgi:ATP-dependent helicase/DNAse subunit B
MLRTMALELISGPPNSGRAGAVVARFRAALGARPMLVVPTADDVSSFERALCEEGDATRGGTITTFAGLAREVVTTLALELGPPLSAIQRQALVRAAIRRATPRLLSRSAARPGFAPAADRLIAELGAAMLAPAAFRAAVAQLDDAGYEAELAAVYSAYAELRDASGRSDAAQITAAAIAGLRDDPGAWGERPVLVYGFDDLARDQTELLAGLAGSAPVTIAVTFADSRALSARARLLHRLADEYGAERSERLPFDPSYTESATLRHLDRNLFEPRATPVDADDGLVLMDSAGPRGEAEAIGIEIARLLADGVEADAIAVVVRHPDSSGPVLARVLAGLGIGVALEASIPVGATCVGTSLVALCRAAEDDDAVDALLAHLRTDPSVEPRIVDWVQRRVRRGRATTVSAAVEGWANPPRHLARLRDASGRSAQLRALARSARELAEGPHRERAPLAGTASAGGGTTPFSALELRAGVAVAELLTELADLGELPGAEQPGLGDAIEALESATVPHWRGPASGRVRIMSPYRARTARVRALFVAGLNEGVFPSAAPPDPLLSEERRAELGNQDLRRADQADEERYLFHACVSRPTDRLYLSWQSCDEDGEAKARSPFVDEVLDLVAATPDDAGRLIRVRGPERALIDAGEATTARLLARALARAGWGADREAALGRLGVGGDAAARALAPFAALPDPDRLPGPLATPAVLERMRERTTFSAGSLEGWVTCSYRWFVSHELSPQLLDPTADPLWIGGVVHAALERLYAEAPGDDSIPRPADLRHWQRRFGELLDEAAAADQATLSRPRRAALERARAQVDAFLAEEASTETEFRPARELLELGFGELDHQPEGAPEPRPALTLGEIELRGRIDRIDLAADGRSAIVRDYKTGKQVPSADKFEERGALQIQLYMLVAQRVLGLDPVGGLYQPLGATVPKDRRARGVVDADDPRLEPLDLVRSDRKPAEELEGLLERAEAIAVETAAAIRAGRIRRDPLNGECPSFCTYQPICRLERALGDVGDEPANGGDES